VFCRIPNAISFEVYPRDLYGTHKQLPHNTAVWHPQITWSIATAPPQLAKCSLAE